MSANLSSRIVPAAGSTGLLPDLSAVTAALNTSVVQALALPFDSARMHYAQAVRLGFIERSMLRSRDFESLLGRIERTVLGPWARRN